MKRSETFREFAETGELSGRLKEKSIHGALYQALSGGLDFILRLVSTFLLARLLAPDDFGVVAMVTAVTVLADIFRDLGLSTATIQARKISHDQVSNLLWINVAAGAILSGVFCLASPFLTWFYGDPRVAAVGYAISTTFFLGGLGVQHQALLSRQLRQGQMAFIRLGASLASTTLAVWMAMTGFGYWALVWREVARALLVTAGMWTFCRWVPGRPKRGVNLHELLRFGAHLTITNLVVSAVMNCDRLVIGKLFGAEPLGLFRQAQQLIMAPIDQINGPITNVSQPGLSMLQDSPERYRRYYARILMVVALLTMPIGLFFAIYAPEVTLLMLGPDWMAAAPFLRIFACAAIIRPAIATSANVLITCGKSQMLLNLNILHCVVLFAMLLIGVRWGAIGVAFAHFSTTCLLALPKLYYSFRGTPISLRTFGHALAGPVLASSALAVALLALRNILPAGSALSSISWALLTALIIYPASLLVWNRSRWGVGTLLADLKEALPRRRAAIP